jgi:hypothetical protein
VVGSAMVVIGWILVVVVVVDGHHRLVGRRCWSCALNAR